jgi:hypothetical protein
MRSVMNTSRNPYSPPRAPVADIPQITAAQVKKSLLPLWFASLYCIVIGVWHAIMLITALYHARDLLDWPMPPWVYALGFIQPVARIAGGVSFIRRSRLSPMLLATLAAVTALWPILWQLLLRSQTGATAVPSGPVVWLGLADLTLLILIARYAFALRSRGILR